MDALTTNSHRLSGDRVAPASEQHTKAAKNVANILLSLCLADVVLEDGYRAEVESLRLASGG